MIFLQVPSYIFYIIKYEIEKKKKKVPPLGFNVGGGA